MQNDKISRKISKKTIKIVDGNVNDFLIYFNIGISVFSKGEYFYGAIT